MARTRMVCVLLVISAGLLLARGTPASTETVIKFHVTPMASPVPALKYQLLPELREMNPGNPVQGYLKCFMERNAFYHSKESEEERKKWLEMPLKDLPVEKLRDYGGKPLRFADSAASLCNAIGRVLLGFGLAHGHGAWTPMRLLLTGVVIAAGFGALVSLMLALGPESRLRGMVFWLMGDFSITPSSPLPPVSLRFTSPNRPWPMAATRPSCRHSSSSSIALPKTKRARLAIFPSSRTTNSSSMPGQRGGCTRRT